MSTNGWVALPFLAPFWNPQFPACRPLTAAPKASTSQVDVPVTKAFARLSP